MAFRKRYRRRRARPAYRRRRFRMKRGLTSAYVKIIMKAKVVFGTGSAGGTPVSGAFLLNYPGYVNTGVNPPLYTLSPIISNYYTRAFQMFDEFRVQTLKLELRGPITNTVQTVSSLGPTGSNYYPEMFTVLDYDDGSILTDLNQALSSNNSRRHWLANNGRPIKRIQHNKGLVDRKSWFNCQARDPNTVKVPGQTMPKTSSIKFFISNALINEPMVDVLATWVVLFRGYNTLQKPTADTEFDESLVGVTGSARAFVNKDPSVSQGNTGY